MIGCTCPVCQSHRSARQAHAVLHLPAHADGEPARRHRHRNCACRRCGRSSITSTPSFSPTPHADHIMGFDDLRRFCDLLGGPMPIYGAPETLKQIERIFYYAFNPKIAVPGYVHVTPHPVTAAVRTRRAHHHAAGSAARRNRGHRLSLFPRRARPPGLPQRLPGGGRRWWAERIHGVEVLIIDGLREKPHPTHLNVSGALEAIPRHRAEARLSRASDPRCQPRRAGGPHCRQASAWSTTA